MRKTYRTIRVDKISTVENYATENQQKVREKQVTVMICWWF
jgi:hypothetical protein